MVKKLWPKSVLLLSLFCAVNLSFGQSLNGIPGLALWLRADTGVTTIGTGDSVTVWADALGNTAVSTAGDRPTLITAPTLNNKPSLKFNGHTQFLSGQPIAALNNNSSLCGEYEFIVCKADSAATGTHGGILTIDTNSLDGMWLERFSLYGLGELFINNVRTNQGYAYLNYGPSMPNTAFPYKIFEVRKTEGVGAVLDVNGTQVASILNGANGGPQMCGPFVNGPFNIGFAPGYGGTDGYFDGEIAEIIVYTGCLTGGQIQQVETYLENKYSPSLSIGPRDTVITHGLCPLTLTAPAGFNSYLWSTGATTTFISAPTSGTYWVKATDMFGGVHYDTTTITYPVISLNSTALLCQGGSTELVPNLSSFAGYTFKWTGGATTDSISVNAGGNYSVTVTDANNCTVVSNTETVTVDAFASTVSLGAAASHCAGNRISLTSPTTGWSNLLFHWSNGSTDSLLEVTAPSGPYSVTVTDANGCSGSASVSVTITGVAPHVNFSYIPVCSGLPFAPYNLSDSTGVTYSWNFGDGSPVDTSRFPTHSYNSNGTYAVHLTVKTGSCTNDTIIPVTVNALPLAAFQSGLACTSDPSFTFNDLSIPAPGQSIATWNWTFGDPLGGTSSVESPTYTYVAQQDTYQVTLTVVQQNGCQATVTNPFIVEFPPGAPSAPVLEFPVNGSVSASDSVTFGWQSAPGAVYYQLLVSTDPSFSSADSFYNNIYTNQKVIKLSSNTTYFWKVTAFNPCGDFNASVVDTVTTFSPAYLLSSNIALWLRADSGVVATPLHDSVSIWHDVSGHGYDAFANNATLAGSEPMAIPQVPLLNHMPSVFFNATSNVMTSAGPVMGIDSQSLTVFIVTRTDGPLPGVNPEPGGLFTTGTLNTGMWIERHPTLGYAFINDFLDPNLSGLGAVPHDTGAMPDYTSHYRILGLTKNQGSIVILDTNGYFSASSTEAHVVHDFANTTYNLGHPQGVDPYSGNAPYGYLNGEIAELIIYNTLLTGPQQQQVNNYLYNKYAPPVNLGPDIVQNYSLCPVVLHTGNRFVSYLWSTGQTSDTIIVTQGGKYWVRTTDVFNRVSSDTINVKLPYQGSNPDTDYVCHGDTGQIIQLINQPSSYNYVWYDSTSPSSVVNLNINADIIHPYSAGYYYTKITDTSHCFIITNKVPVIIDNFYAASLLPLNDTICKFSTIVVNPGPYTIDSFLWQPIADTESAPVISNAGTYYLSSVDNHGCKNYDSTIVTTRAQAPAVNFTVPNYCLSNTTYFVDSSFAAPGDSIASYFWNYGGGIPSTDTTVNGKTSYEINYGYGHYTVSLKVTTDSGCYAIKTKHINILASPKAGYADSANNSVYPYILCAGAGSSLQLTDTSSAIGGSALVQRFWKFNGVVNADNNATIQYTFATQGQYNITLEVVNTLGCADSITQQITVNPPFVANFTFSDHCLGDYTTFTNLTQSLSIVNTLWKFRENGDGPYAYTANAQIQFSAPGNYDVELQEQNAIGCISTFDTMVKIVQKPAANFNGLIACQNRNYTPLDASVTVNDVINQWSWNIGGILSNVESPKVSFPDTGALIVSLKISTAEGCADSVTKIVEVGPVPSALFSFTPLYGTAPLLVTFTNRSKGGTTYDWNFGDGTDTITYAPQINPAPHNYQQNGDYNVSLYAYNDYGCYDSLVRTINVMPTDLCLGIESVQTSTVPQPDGSELVTVIVYFSNLGTRVITSVDLYATLGTIATLEQNWNGYLRSGQTIIDTIPAQFVAPAGYTNTYVCVSATNINGGETESNCGSNNQECVSLTGSMQLMGPSPNPAGSTCQLGIIMPQAGTVYISIMDEMGRYIVREFSANLPAEQSTYNIPVEQLEGGEYFIRVRYNDDIEVRKFVVR